MSGSSECKDRDRRRAERRIRAAHFPREKSLRDFDYRANPNVDAAVIHNLATCDRITKGYPLCLIGDSGTGKSQLLSAAIVDLLTFNAALIETGTESYRLARTKANKSTADTK